LLPQLQNQRHCQIKQKIVWHDPNIIDESDTSGFVKEISQFCENYTIENFSDFKKTSEYIKNSSESLIIITSGKNGEDLVNLIHNYKNVLAILVFCFKVESHKIWAVKFPKIHGVYNERYQVYNSLAKFHNSYCVIFKHCFVEIEESVAKEFWRVIFEYLKVIKSNGETNNKNILKELINLNDCAEKEIEKTFVPLQIEILKAIIYLYSTNLIYNQFNECLYQRLYKKLLNTMTTTAKELLFNDHYSVQFFAQGGVLYRGVKGIVNEILEEYNGYLSNNIQPLFFPAFLSTSSNFEVVKKPTFSNGIIFEIHLSKMNPHPHLRLISDEWSKYPGEEETLIYAYFPFFVDKIVQKDNFWLITLIQADENKVFSKKSEEMKVYWREVIKKEIIADLKEEVQFQENFMDRIIEKIEENGSIENDNIFLEVIKESNNLIFIIINVFVSLIRCY